ncbi:MAG: hypothetical protein ACOCQX_04590 [Candidatus Nanoarchaeia archaeon]
MARIKNHMIVILGATHSKYLFEALYNLYEKGIITQTTPILCVDSLKLTKNTFIDYIQLEKRLSAANSMILSGFQQLINYARAQNDFTSLFNTMEKLDKKNNCRGNKIFFMADEPANLEPFLDVLSGEALKGRGFKRVIYNTKSGLDKKMIQVFGEEQCFRLNHSIHPEAIKRLLAVRFENSLFKGWKKGIDNIQISLHGQERLADLLEITGLMVMNEKDAVEKSREIASLKIQNIVLGKNTMAAKLEGKGISFYVRSGSNYENRVDVVFGDNEKNNIFTIPLEPARPLKLKINTQNGETALKGEKEEVPLYYESVIKEVMTGNKTPFHSHRESEAIEKFQKRFNERAAKEKVHNSKGEPKPAADLLKRDKRFWVA